MDLKTLTISQAHQALKQGDYSAAELTATALARVKELDGSLRSFITVTGEQALAQAKDVDQKLATGAPLGLLAGLPAGIKDVILTKDVLTTASSKMLANYLGVYDATVVAKLKAQEMVMIGKNNCDAFAHGSSTENSDFGPSHNPWDLSRVPGGSSGGSAAAVAAGLCLYSIGTDTGGSIRQPASFCGLVGLKPTYGRASRYGLIAMTSSTDVPGVLAKTVEDCAIVLEAMAGRDPLDATTVDKPVPSYSKLLTEGKLDSLTVGVPKEYFIKGLEPAVEIKVREAIKELAARGAKIKEISLPHTAYAVATYYIITPAEVSANLARYDGLRYGYSVTQDAKFADEAKNLSAVYNLSRRHGFGAEAKRRIMIGTYALSSGYYDAYYLQAAKVRTLIKRDFDLAFKEVDLIATPTAPHPAFKIGEQTDDPLQMYLEDIFVIAASLAGLPAVSLPCGFASADGESNLLPVGLQLIGPQFSEVGLLQAAYQYEQATDWHLRQPDI